MFAERVYLGLEKLKELRDTEVDEDDEYLEHHGILGQKWGTLAKISDTHIGMLEHDLRKEK